MTAGVRLQHALLHGYADGTAICAWRRGRAIPVDAFLADVAELAARLPDRGHVLNVVADRYRFAIGFAAAALRGQISLLPPSTHTATIAQLRVRFPDAYCLTETPQVDIDLPQVMNDRADGQASGRAQAMPMLPAEQTVAYVFTSGSTGIPTMHRKRWGALVVNVRAEGERLGCTPDGPRTAIVATVPAQHMYGFESSVMMPLQSGHALVAERPFYPADIAAALDALPASPARRMLVTTPFHLHALLDATTTWPGIDTILCATAPLSTALAARAEHASGAPVLEIYGCTETGQLASRRPVVDAAWRLLGNVMLHAEGGRTIATSGHVEEPTPLGDVIELAADFASSRRFTLAGRAADLVNIAGKRTSLGHLDVQLNAIDGVVDGVFIAPAGDDADGTVERLAAVVVAPTLDAARLVAALRTRIDAVFLPRPIHFVDRLPRNETGKVTQAGLHALLDEASSAPATRARRPGTSPDGAKPR